MSEWLPIVAVLAGALAIAATLLGIWIGFVLALFKLLARMRKWRGPLGWWARHFRYRNQVTVFRLSWVLPLYQRRYPRILLNMTENGPTSFTRQWTRNIKTNKKRGTWSINTPGGGSLRGGRGEKELDGDVAKLPTLRWAKTGEYAQELEDEHGGFPIYRVNWNGWALLKHRRPGTKRGWIYWVEGAENAHFRTQPAMLEALGWEPVVGMKRHSQKPDAVYEEWPEDIFEEA